MPPNTIKVSRPSRWGNPFKVSSNSVRVAHYADFTRNVDLWHGWPVADRAAAVAAYRAMKAPHLDVAVLRGKNLACWCPLDQPCHADVLLELANVDEAQS